MVMESCPPLDVPSSLQSMAHIRNVLHKEVELTHRGVGSRKDRVEAAVWPLGARLSSRGVERGPSWVGGRPDVETNNTTVCGDGGNVGSESCESSDLDHG